MKSTSLAPVKPRVKPLRVIISAEAGVRTYRGARAKWYAAIANLNGETLTDACNKLEANPPSLPTKGKNKGKVEPPMGWIRFFVTEGVLRVE